MLEKINLGLQLWMVFADQLRRDDAAVVMIFGHARRESRIPGLLQQFQMIDAAWGNRRPAMHMRIDGSNEQPVYSAFDVRRSQDDLLCH
jgi:hypothetical protein